MTTAAEESVPDSDLATLLGGEFDNCHGQGPTPDQARVSLLLTVRAKRRQLAAAATTG